MLYYLALYLYRFLVASIILVDGFFSIYFLSVSGWGQKLGQTWYNVSVSTLNLFQVIVERYLHLNIVWDYLIVPWLLLPVWAAIVVLWIAAAVKLWLLRIIFDKIA